jgi:putative peptide zinc metalloprotease protein
MFHIFHELGHAAAGKRFGIKSKGIGFGFYWLLPVFFSDMSNAWSLERNHRIIINLGGIYFDMLITALWYMLFLYTSNPFFLIYPTIILLGVITNLNFFIKYDGYWVLSDALRIPNLHKRAFQKLQEAMKIIFKRIKPVKFSVKDGFLAVYSFTSSIYLFVILGMAVIYSPQTFLSYPLNVYRLFLTAVTFQSHLGKEELASMIFPTVMCILFGKVLFSYIKNKNKYAEK